MCTKGRERRGNYREEGGLTSLLAQYQPHVSRFDDSHIDQSQNTSRGGHQTFE
jgi:hypothetical protein